MTNVQKEKINFPRVAPFIALSFAIGFGVATGAYFIVFCEDCFSPSTTLVNFSPAEKCQNDLRCIEKPPVPPTPEISSMGMIKIGKISEIVNESIIQDALKKSNEEFSIMSDSLRDDMTAQREKEWTTVQKSSPFMISIVNNDVADFLRENLVISSEEYGDVVFGEHILTNIYGPNVAVSIRTDNYDQSNDDWWQESLKLGRPLVRQCEFDESAQMYSEDIVVKIFDSNGEFIGIMNSATPCDVTQKASETKTKIVPVPLDNITPIGKHKISKLQELMSDQTIQDALRLSNEEFAAIGDVDVMKLREEFIWPPPQKEVTAFQLSILNNKVSDFLRENLVMQTEEFGEISFGEFILTNSYGANVAITSRTYNYIQSPDEWWQVAVKNDFLARECGWDKSVQMTSEDIIIAIYDDKEEFVGVLNSATTCDVIQNKSPTFFGDSN